MTTQRWLLAGLLVGVISLAACVEIQQLAANLGAEPADNTNANANDNSANDNSANDNSNTNEPDDIGPTPPPDNDNTNSSDQDIPGLPDGAELTTTETGLQYYDFEVGDGESPTLENTVRLSYTGSLMDGTVFDSNEDAQFALSRVVDGFGEGVAGMNVGGHRLLVIPPDLGYGENGNANAGIGGDDTIVFDVTLFEIVQ